MAFRRRKTAERRATKRNKTKPFTLPPLPSQDGNTFSSPSVVQLPTNPPPDNTCQLMQWGTSNSPVQVSVGGPGYGPQIQLNPEPPNFGAFSNITPMEFQQFWGTTDANGNYFLNASASINLNFDILMSTSPTQPLNGNWSLFTVLPGMMYYSIRLTSKARVKKIDGSIINCWFEVKNIIPFMGYTSTPPGEFEGGIDIGGGSVWGGFNQTWLQDGSGFLPNNHLQFFFSIQQLSISKCLWANQGLVFHPQGQPLGGVNGSYGLDANFGLDMNQSIPLVNDFSYGEIIYLEGITASINPWWGFENCSYAVAVDQDGDGLPDDYYGTYISDPMGNIVGISGSAGSNLQTMVPGAPVTLVFGD